MSKGCFQLRLMKIMTFNTLILSSAGANFPYLLGMVNTLEKSLNGVTRIIGTSAGAIIAMLLAAGFSAKEIFQTTQERKVTREAFARLNFFHLFYSTHLVESEWMRAILVDLLTQKGIDSNMTMKEFKTVTGVRLTIPVFDIQAGEPFFFDGDSHDASVVDVVMASAAVPLIFPPVTINGRVYCDGALTHFFPGDLLSLEESANAVGVLVKCSNFHIASTEKFEWIYKSVVNAVNYRTQCFNQYRFPILCTEADLDYTKDGDVMYADVETRSKWILPIEAHLKNGKEKECVLSSFVLRPKTQVCQKVTEAKSLPS